MNHIVGRFVGMGKADAEAGDVSEPRLIKRLAREWVESFCRRPATKKEIEFALECYYAGLQDND